MQPRFVPHHIHHHQHHHHHVPVFLLCPCSCHRQCCHQFPRPCPHFPTPPRSNQKPPGVPCVEVLPSPSSSLPPQDHCPTRLGGDRVPEATAEVKSGDFSTVGLEDQAWLENQVDKNQVDDDDDDAVFVLTDEWREFFAKSEAKRKKARQQKSRSGNLNRP